MALLTSVALHSGLGAQEPESPLLRGGQLSLFHHTVVSIYDERFGYREGFAGIEPLGFDFASEALGVGTFPALTAARDRLAALARDSAFALDMGAVDARLSSVVYRVPLGASLGIFDWLTVGGTFPVVKRRTEVDLALRDGNANVGLSPGSGATDLLAFLAEAQAALGSVLTQVDATCSSLGDMDPACVDGRAFLTDADAFLSELGGAYDGPLFFLDGSAEAALLRARVDAWRTDLRSRGDSLLVDSVFVTDLPFAAETVGLDTYQSFITQSEYDVVGAELEDFTSIWELGDIEIWGAVRLLSRDQLPARSVGRERGIGPGGADRLQHGCRAVRFRNVRGIHHRVSGGPAGALSAWDRSARSSVELRGHRER